MLKSGVEKVMLVQLLGFPLPVAPGVSKLSSKLPIVPSKVVSTLRDQRFCSYRLAQHSGRPRGSKNKNGFIAPRSTRSRTVKRSNAAQEEEEHQKSVIRSDILGGQVAEQTSRWMR